MNPHAHYARTAWGRVLALQRLTDARITYYKKRGRYQREARLRQAGGNRLVYSV